MKKERLRQQYLFWLNMNNADDAALARRIAELKAHRIFVQTIRDGIRLIQDLQAGRLDVLLALFPWVTEHLQSPLYSYELAALLERFQQVVINGQPNSSTPQFDPPSIPEAQVVRNETEAIQRSILNTLAALEDF